MRDEDCRILVKCFFEEMFLKEIDDNKGAERERLSIKEDLAWPQVEANFFETNCFLVLINDLAPEVGQLTALGPLWK